MMENSIYKYVSGAERLIFMSLPDNQNFNFIKIIDKTFIDIFSKFINVEMSRFVTKETYNQIVGGFVVFKVTPETMEKISESETSLDASFVVTSMGIYCFLKKFLYTNDSQLLNTLSEVTAYIDVELKTQFGKYQISPDDFVINREMSLFLAFSGLQTFKIEEETSNAIKKAHFNLFKKKQPENKQIKEQIIPEIENKSKVDEKNIKNKSNKDNSTLQNSNEEFSPIEKEEQSLKREGELKYIVKEWLKFHFLPREVVMKAEKQADQATKEKYENKKRAIEIVNKKNELKAKKENDKHISTNKNTDNSSDSEDSDDVGL